MHRAGALLIFCLLLFTSVASGFEAQAPTAVLMDARTAKVLYAKNPDLRREPASTTKILTALVTVDNVADLDTLVTVSAKATATEGSNAQLKAGMKVPMRELLYAMLMLSGNDAATAIAEHVAGSVASFAKLMNTRAKAAGATHSNFVNPSGLPASAQYSTARDLALIGRAAMRNSTLEEICATREHRFAWFKASSLNHNKLLWTMPGADGIKNGYTIAARHTWIGSATRGGLRLITAVLGAESRAVVLDDQERMLEYGFALYKSQATVSRGETLGQLRVRRGEASEVDVVAQSAVKVWTLPDQAPLEKQIELPEFLEAPVATDTVVGKLRYVSGSDVLAEVALVPAAAVAPLPAWARVGHIAKWGSAGAVGTVGLAFLIRTVNFSRRRLRRWQRQRQARIQWRHDRRTARHYRMSRSGR